MYLYLGGEYCDRSGLASPSGLCDPGYYCTSASTAAAPGDSPTTGHCTPGFYCPGGSSQPEPCKPGHFCATAYLNETSGLCSAGYYCTQKAVIPNPTDSNITGKERAAIY